MTKEKDEVFRLSKENLEWFRDNYKSIRRKYDNQWVAVREREVVASSSSYDQVIGSLKKEDMKSAIVEFVDSKQIAMFF
jgi:hypothetical protein